MKKITEQQLIQSANILNKKLAIMEADQQPVSRTPSWLPTRDNTRWANPPAAAPLPPGAGGVLDTVSSKAPAGPVPQSAAPAAPQSAAPAAPQSAAPASPQSAAKPAAPSAPASTDRDWSWQNVGKAAGNVWQGVKNTAGAVTGAASDLATGFNSAQTSTGQQSGSAAQAAPTNKWPTTPQEITAFQKANGLKADGLIGPNTMQALAKQGIQPPAGFKMAGPKKAAPAKPTDPMAQSPEEAEDERIAQNQAFYNMSPEQQAMYNKGVAQQGQKPAAAPANAQTPATAPNAAAAAITPNFASQQAVKESVDPEMTRFKNLISVEDIFENIQPQDHVSFQQEDTLARIIQLSKKEIK